MTDQEWDWEWDLVGIGIWLSKINPWESVETSSGKSARSKKTSSRKVGSSSKILDVDSLALSMSLFKRNLQTFEALSKEDFSSSEKEDSLLMSS
jgi:hypothetical protein